MILLSDWRMIVAEKVFCGDQPANVQAIFGLPLAITAAGLVIDTTGWSA